MIDILTRPFLNIIFENPIFLYTIPFVVIILGVLIWKNFVGKGSRRKKILFFISRSLIVSLLIVALANPFIFEKKIVEGNPRIKFLIDNSSSMQLFDDDIDTLIEKLKEQIPVIKKQIASGESSPLGDNILSNVERNENILLYTDGQITYGEDIESLFSLISNLNVTINAIKLNPKESDASVAVFAPSETVPGSNNNFLVSLERASKGNVPLKVTIDSQVIFNSRTPESVTLSQTFLSEGYHTIKAEILEDDFFLQNNVFYKTIKVIKRPKILYITRKDAPFKKIINTLYDVEESSNIPSDLSQYYGVIINDIKSKDIENIDSLKEFLIDNNGLFVLGGFNSFDFGDYEGSPFMELLPVNLGTGEIERGGVNVVLLIDISGSTGQRFGEGIKVDVEKALAISVLETLGFNNNVGALAFNDQAYLIEDLNLLIYNKQSMRDKISSLKYDGGTYMNVGLAAAYQMLKNRKGSKYIIVLSDGRTQNKLQTLNLASLLASQNIKTITVGVGEDTDTAFMIDLARKGKGFYLQSGSSDRLKVLFGEISEDSGAGNFGLLVLNENHFITDNMVLTASLNAFNQVVPKKAADLLITTDKGRPALTTWRFGLGRVAALNVFAGSNTLGSLLNSENSQLLSRTINWIIGNPERKKEKYIKIKDSRIGENVEIILKSPNPPKSDIEFQKFDENKYIARIKAESVGFHEILDGKYGVSYNKEYENIGFNPKLEALVESTGGKMFETDQVDEIVEHVKEKSKRLETVKENLLLYILIPVIIIFLIEVSVRRWFEVKK